MNDREFQAAMARLSSTAAGENSHATEGVDPAALNGALAPVGTGTDAATAGSSIIDALSAMEGAATDVVAAPPQPAPIPEAEAPAEPLTEEQKALTPGYYQEHGEPSLGRPDVAADMAQGAIGGAVASVLETKDFLFGEPEEGREVDQAGLKRLQDNSILGGMSVGIGQFAAGMYGLGKFASVAKALPWFGKGFQAADAALDATKAGRAAGEIAKAATVGAVAFDPHEERLSNLVQSGPFANPVTRFLAADPADTAAEGRFKSALESIGFDLAIIGTLAGGLKVYKALRSGDAEAAERFTAEAEAEIAAALQPAEAIGQDNLRAIQAGNQNLSRSRGIVGGTEALPEEGSRFPIPEAGKGPGAAPDAANLNPKTPDVRADNDQPAVQADGVAAVEIGEPREGYATTGALKPGSGSGAAIEPANANASLRRPENDNAAFGPVPEETTRSGGELPALSADDEVGLEAGGLGGTEAPKTAALATTRPRRLANDVAPSPAPQQVGASAPGASTPSVQFADEDTAAVLQGMSADAEAMTRFGGWNQAIENGHTFGRGEGVPYAKLNTEADQAQFMARVVDAAEERIATIKGGDILRDARVQQLVNQRAALFNDDPASVLGMLQQSGQMAARMVADMEAGYLVTARTLQDTYALARRIQGGDFSAFRDHPNPAEAAVTELKKRLAFAASSYAAARSITSNAGRAMRRMRRDFALNPEDVAKLQGLDGRHLVEVIAATDGNPRQLARAANPSWWDKTVDFGQFLLINNLVSGPKTQLINAVTNAYMVGARPMERILGSVPGAVAGNPTSRAILRESVRQYTYMGSALMEGFGLARKAFMANDSILAPHRTELYRGNQGAAKQGIQWKPWTSTGNILHNALLVATTKAIGMPTRTLGFVDELVKQTVYRSKVMSKAHFEAAEKAAESGLRGADAKQFMRDYIADRLDNSFDDMGRGVDPEAIREAQIATFQQDLLPGTFGKVVVQPAVAAFPALRLVLPFVKTPTNVIRYGWKMTPVLNLLQREYRDMLRGAMGPEVQAQAVGQMTMGTLFMGAAAYLVSQGTVTGGGPKDYKLRQELLATGWQPYSVVVENEDGSRTYLPFNRYDPVAIPFGIIADLQDAINNWSEDGDEKDTLSKFGSAIGALSLGLAKQFTSKTYLTGVSQVLDAMADPEQRGATFFGRTAANFVPFSAALRQGNPDPYLREARAVVDHVLNTIPGLSETVPARYDAFGDPIVARKGLWSSDEDAIVDREMQRLAVENGKAPVRVGPTPEGGIDLRDLTMGDGRNAYAAYQQWSGHIPGAKRSLKQVVAKLIQSEAYQSAPDGDINTKGTKLNLLSRPITKYRSAAMARLKADPVVRAAFMKEKLKVRDAYRTARQQRQEEQRPTIGEAFGQEIDALFGGDDQ